MASHEPKTVGHEQPTLPGPHRPSFVTAVVLSAAMLTMAAFGCSVDWDAAPIFEPPSGVSTMSTLRAAEDCEDLADGTRPALELALDSTWSSPGVEESVGDAGVGTGGDDAGSDATAAFETAPPPPTTAVSAPESAPASTGEREVIGTNVQEAEVDEADIVKTDGRRIVTLTDGVVRVVGLDGEPAVRGVLAIDEGAAAEMFLRGDEVVVIGSTGGIAMDELPMAGMTMEDMTMPFTSATTLTIVSVEDPANPTVTASASVEGDYVSSRRVDDRIRLVVRSWPEAVDDVMMSFDESSARAAVASLDGDDLLPRIAVDGAVGRLGGCDDVLVLSTAAESVDSFSPTPTISSITTLSIGETLDDLAPVTIQGDAETVYASTDALYVTSGGWDGNGSHTDVHRFALDPEGPAAYTGSGRTPGRLLNQFSLSERDGALRVVTTVDGPAATSARLTVLDTDGDTLDEIGHIDGLGMGEEVKSVRFIEDLGYVVTFRTTDPLYALDLSDPRAPRVLGELKIPGFSEYLHPIGGGLLLGVGRQADPNTGMDEGFKVSLFDISDPAAMTEVDQIVIPGAWSPIRDDHKAFLWDAGRGQALIPVERYSDLDGSSSGAALVVRVDGAGAEGATLDIVAELAHPGAFGRVAPIRSFVVDEDLWTLSQIGLGRTSADDPGEVDLLRF